MKPNLIKIIKALADENRLRIINLLCHNTLCVCEIEEILSLNQSNLSRHLNKLLEAEILNHEKRGLFMMYSLNREAIENSSLLKTLIEETLPNEERFNPDNKKYQLLKECGLCKIDK